MKQTATHRTGWLLLLGCCFAGAARRTGAQGDAQDFEVATVRPAPGADPTTGSWSPPGHGRFVATHVPLTLLLQLAYELDKSQITNKPGWLDTELFDINAEAEPGIQLSRKELQPRLQHLLITRFHLVAHYDVQPVEGYALVVAKGGSHLTPTKADHFPGFRVNVSPGQMRGANWSMPILARYLTSAAGFPVADQTGIGGSYDIGFSYDPDPDAAGDLPPLSRALQNATGLVLRPQRVQVRVLVIDAVNRSPTAN